MNVEWTFDGNAAAAAIQVRPHVLRNWRRAGLFDFGHRQGKGYLYSAPEIACLAVASFVARYGFTLQAAFAIAWNAMNDARSGRTLSFDLGSNSRLEINVAAIVDLALVRAADEVRS